MNSSPPLPEPKQPSDAAEINAALSNKLCSYRRRGRLLMIAALSVGMLAIVAGIFLGWASVYLVGPMERLLVQEYPNAVTDKSPKPDAVANGGPRPPLTHAELDFRHAQVTLAHGKALVVTAVAVVLQGIGTLLTLLLVIFNRQVTLRQINANLEQISRQIDGSK